MSVPLLVFCSFAAEAEAQAAASALVSEGLAACVSLLPGVRSTYRWLDGVEQATEVMGLIKSSRQLWPQLCTRLRELHSYEVPEIIAVDPADMSADYRAWLMQSLRGGATQV